MKQNLGRYLGRPGRSLTRRLIWLAAAWIVVALLVTGLVLTSQFQESGLRRLGGVNNNTIDELVVAASVRDGQVVVPQIEDSRTKALLSGKYWAVAERNADGDLVVIARSTSLWDSEMPIPASLTERVAEVAGGTVSYNAVGPNNGEPLRVAASQKQLPGREQPVVFIAALNRSNIDSDTRQFATLTWAALGLLGVGLMAAVFFQVRIGLRPLYELGQEIGDVRKGRATRITQDYPVEIAPLAEQLNKLLDHNQEVVERQRTHVGNLAHALKTPLSVMLAEAEGRDDPLAEVVTRQSGVMKDQVDHHLRRARAAARAQGLGERTPVAEVLDEMAVMLERVFASKDVEIDWRAPDDLMFRGERQDLQEILGNLIENACKWARRRVRVSAGATGLGQMVVVVEDDGPGLAEDQWEAALKRGTRMDEDAPGSGLGLSIVDDLTRAYNGRVALSQSEMGGLKAVLDLPAAEG